MLGLCAFLLGGCTTLLSGGPVIKDKTGIRYSLPAPHLFFNPQPDGTVSVEVKYLPDPDNTYTLNIASYFSSATFDVKLIDGMLTTVSFDADSSKIPTEALTAAAELQKHRMTLEETADDAAELREEVALAALKAAVKAAQDAVNAQKEKLALLEAKREFAANNPGALSTVEMLALRLDISQQLKILEQLVLRLTLLINNDSNSATLSGKAFNSPVVDSASTIAYGPLLFRVLPDGVGVKLVALESQKSYETSVAAAPATTPVVNFAFLPTGYQVKKSEVGRKLKFVASQTIQTIDDKKLVRPADGASAEPVLKGDSIVVELAADKKSLTLVLPSLEPGAYRLDLSIIVEGSQERQGESITVTVQGD